MSVWSDNPEWFDEWIEFQAAEGRLGEKLQQEMLNGDIAGYEIWEELNKQPDGHRWASAALEIYCERLLP